MVTKMEELYAALLSMKIVTFDDILRKARSVIKTGSSCKNIYRKYVDRLIKKKTSANLKRILHRSITYRQSGKTRVE